MKEDSYGYGSSRMGYCYFRGDRCRWWNLVLGYQAKEEALRHNASS
jgi:hypothetical protein